MSWSVFGKKIKLNNQKSSFSSNSTVIEQSDQNYSDIEQSSNDSVIALRKKDYEEKIINHETYIKILENKVKILEDLLKTTRQRKNYVPPRLYKYT